MISKKIVAASILAAMGTSAHAIGFKAGDWNMDISGSVNAYYNTTSCDQTGANAAAGTLVVAAGALNVCGVSTNTGQDRTTIQNGLLPGFIVFSASTKQAGYDLKAVISIDPGTTNTGATAFSGGVGQTVGDQRRVYLEFGNATMGTIKAGRDIGLFGQNAILNDMSLLAVGGGSGYNGALNTTLGGIGSGYVYTEFQPQITYSAPAMGNLSISAGVFQPKLLNGAATATTESSTPGLQALASYSLGDTGKLWGAMISNSQKSATVANDVDLTGFEVGGTLNFGSLSLMGNYFTGEGLGTTLIGFGGADTTGVERDSQGYIAQATYKIGNTKLGVNYGSSSLDSTASDRTNNTLMLDETNQFVVGIYHNLTPSLTIAAEYINTEQKYQLGTAAQRAATGEASTFALGAILFF